MGKILRFFIPAVVLTLCSCLGDEDNDFYSPKSAITYFSIGNFTYKSDYITKDGRDTTLTISSQGSLYPMTIDQVNNKIYNVDSLPFGTKTSAMLVSVAASGPILYRVLHSDNTYMDTVWTSVDSVNLSSPTKFFVYSSDLSFKREYDVQLNVRKVHPDSMKWTRIVRATADTLSAQVSLYRNDSIFVIGRDSEGLLKCFSLDCNTRDVSTAASVIGLNPLLWTSRATIFNDTLYTLQNGKLYGSANGNVWTEGAAAMTFRHLIPCNGTAVSGGVAWAISSDDKLVYSKDMSSWNVCQEVPTSFPDTMLNCISYTLPTNRNIVRYVVAGIDTTSKKSSASIWTKLSGDSLWTEMTFSETNSLLCPRLTNLHVIRYDGNLYAFGGKSEEGYGQTAGLNGFFQSSDNGVTWRDCEKYADGYYTWNKYMEFPSWLKGKDSGFTGITDMHGYIWIFTDDAIISCGAINRLVK